MVTAVLIAFHCPSCGRRLGEAEAIKGDRRRCKSCGAALIIDLVNGTLTVQASRVIG